MNKKIVFLGTPEVASEILSHIVENGICISAVITQPDKPTGRNKILTSPPVKKTANKFSIKTYQPDTDESLEKVLKELFCDYAIVVSYGRILKENILNILPYGFYNIHFSLLPKYRGADPVRKAILNLESESGVTIFKIDKGIDSGDMLLKEKILIYPDDTSTTLFKKLIPLSKKMIMDAIKIIDSGNIRLTPQTGEVSYAHKINVNDTFIDFREPSIHVYAKVRAFSFDPYSRFYFKRKDRNIVVQIISAKHVGKIDDRFMPGSLVGFEKGKGILVKCGDDGIFLEHIKPEGGKIVNAYDYFINGMKLNTGDKIYEY